MRLVFQDAVCAPAYKGLTGAQRLFLDVMADDLPGASSVADVASRAGKSRSWANAYRRSLIDASVIEQVGQGRVAYAISHFGEYIQRCRGDRWAFGASGVHNCVQLAEVYAKMDSFEPKWRSKCPRLRTVGRGVRNRVRFLAAGGPVVYKKRR